MTAEAEMLASAGGYGLATKGPMHKKKRILGYSVQVHHESTQKMHAIHLTISLTPYPTTLLESSPVQLRLCFLADMPLLLPKCSSWYVPSFVVLADPLFLTTK